MLIWLESLFVYIHGLEGCLIIVNVFMNCCGLLFRFTMARASSHLLSNTSFFHYLFISFLILLF